jgi:natural product biosynthesis luciferase-like monooxygenase protein
VDFGVMFFGSADGADPAVGYDLVLEVARRADRAGLACIWTPERHFHSFGGLFPNPVVISAAVAAVTQRLQIRAGSLISPLHDPIRIAEDWAVVDRLSHGRAAISFGSGWNADDFVFFPERYAGRRDLVFEQMDVVRRLWRGEHTTRVNGVGVEVSLELHPRPVQASLPVWVTSSGSPETFRRAGSAGANVLTHLVNKDLDQLAEHTQAYRRARAAAGWSPDTGIVSLMLHTYLDRDPIVARDRARAPLREYLRSAVSLEQRAAAAGGTMSGGHTPGPDSFAPELVDEMVELRCERYLDGASLIGSTDTCAPLLRRIAGAGVDEVACLLDFGPQPDEVLGTVEGLADLARDSAARTSAVAR